MFQNSEYISCFLSMPKGELDTAPIIAAILAAGSYPPLSLRNRTRALGPFIPGKVLYVPSLDTSDSSRPRMDMLRVSDQPDLDSFPSGLWGIREPSYERNGQRRANGRFPSTSFVSFLDPMTPPVPQPSTPINGWIS